MAVAVWRNHDALPRWRWPTGLLLGSLIFVAGSEKSVSHDSPTIFGTRLGCVAAAPVDPITAPDDPKLRT
jgi:hypothetical protein